MNSAKRNLFISIFSLVICIAMLVSTTFAWFTDSVTSGINTIVAGNLDIELEYWNGTDWVPVDSSTLLFDDDARWEPGHTEVAHLHIKNAGTLSLKYKMAVNVANELSGTNVFGEEFRLSDYLVFGKVDMADASAVFQNDDTGRQQARAAVGDTAGLSTYTEADNLYAESDANKPVDGKTEKYMALVIYMPETVGNEANYKSGTTPPQIELGVSVVATQLNSENDSFGNTYDDGAMLPILPVPPTNLNFSATATVNPSADTTIEHAASGSTAIIPKGALASEVTQVRLNVTTTDQDEDSVTYDISLKDLDGNDVGIVSGKTVTVKLYVGPYLKNVKVKHGDTPMSEDEYEYNPATGYLTIHTSSFSKFEVTFENMQAEVDKYGVIYAENGTILLSARDLPDDVTEYAVRPGVKMIFPYAFAYNLNLTRVTLPESLEEIGDYAFNECKSLAAVNLGEATNLKKIGNRAFRYCFSLTTLALPPALTEIGPAAFMGCVTLKGPLTIPASVTRIEDQTFEVCYKLKGINLPAGITYIGKNAFKSCESITELTIPALVTYCGNQFIAFERLVDDEGKKVTYSLEKVTFLGENLPELGTSIFLHASRPANDGKQLTIYVETQGAKASMENYLASGNITSAPADKRPEVKIIGQE
jgi:predicted ribosomally synthesized peptide with SipW-like signal peptide